MLKATFLCIYFFFGYSFAQVEDVNVNTKIEEIKEDLDDIDAIVDGKNKQLEVAQAAIIQAEMQAELDAESFRMDRLSFWISRIGVG